MEDGEAGGVGAALLHGREHGNDECPERGVLALALEQQADDAAHQKNSRYRFTSQSETWR